MKTMTCKQLGGACDKTFSADTFDEIVTMSKRHGMEMFEKNDKSHLDAMEEISVLMQDQSKMDEWFNQKKEEFNAL
jgi:phosphatidate phosphatase PAH1